MDEKSDFFNGDWHDVDGISYGSIPEDKADAVKFASSLRGQWVIGMALNMAIGMLNDGDDKIDMRYLQDKLFPLYKRVKERDGWDERRRH